ncbi:hypothetical protein ORI20_23180 [Mycobacterium sp. CVI_P3]|uniref:Uncharacterized protein n=1 Tax=Mycobacterium pinniadriaticum TaxID=2994102 RepID=A0ABT3SJH7_9MYCO|nr:hypothetical protein [Mycobacterium pinniadriaticum]MCX2933178.1 hypothetical protein [Mycobacterium pinniadriaticum]MCX2939522.1 hypothetical protein [Mycobacterium pinniadriaticum]
MKTTTNVVNKRSVFAARGYFFKPAAILTIALGCCLHLYRIVYGDEMTLRYVLNPTTDALLLIPMTYAAVTGILIWRRVEFVNTAHKVFFTWSLVYLTLSVPLHVYVGLIRGDVGFYLRFFGVWFSYLLLPFYVALVTMFWRLRLRP